MTASIGSIVTLYFDTPRQVAEGDVIVNAYRTGRPEARAYEVVTTRQQKHGKHVGRWHLKALVVSSTPEQLTNVLSTLHPQQTVHRMYWYPRTKRH